MSEIDILSRKLDKVENLVFEDNYGYLEAVNKVKYELDGDNLYDSETGQTLNSIDEATQNQLEEILGIKKTLW